VRRWRSVGAVSNDGVSEEQLYATVWAELESGHIQQGLWAKLWAANKGNEEKTKAAYLKERVKQLQKAAKGEEAPASASSRSTSQSSHQSSPPSASTTSSATPTRREDGGAGMYVLAVLGWLVISTIFFLLVRTLIEVIQLGRLGPVVHYFILTPISALLALGCAIKYFSLFKSLNKIRVIWPVATIGGLGVLYGIGTWHEYLLRLVEIGAMTRGASDDNFAMYVASQIIAVTIFLGGYILYWRRKYRLNIPVDDSGKSELSCPHCHGGLRLPAGRSGIVDCPHCRKSFETTT